MAQKSIKRNYLYNVSYQVLVLIAPLITTPYVARILGADGIGIYSYTNSIVSYFLIFAILGTANYGQREISYHQNDIKKRSKAFWEIEIISICTTCLSCLAYIILVLQQTQNQNIYFIYVLNIIAVSFDISWFFQGMEEFGKIVGRNAFFKILNIVCIFLFVKQKTDLCLYILILSSITLLSSMSLWPYLRKYLCKVAWQNLEFKKNIKPIISLFIPTLAIQVYTVLDKTMIGLITKDSFQNGYYEQAEKISKIALTIVTSLSAVMIPRIGHYFAQNDSEKISFYMFKSYHFVWMLGLPLCFGLIGIASNLVPWFFGSGYDEVVPLLRILSMLIVIIGLSNVTGLQYLVPTKRVQYLTLSVSAGAVINFICNYFMIQVWGAVGAAIGSIIAECTVTCIQLWCVRKELNTLSIFSLSIKYLISSIVMLGMLLFLSHIFTPSILHTLLMILAGIAVYAAMLLILKDGFFYENVSLMIQKLHLKIAK